MSRGRDLSQRCEQSLIQQLVAQAAVQSRGLAVLVGDQRSHQLDLELHRIALWFRGSVPRSIAQ